MLKEKRKSTIDVHNSKVYSPNNYKHIAFFFPNEIRINKECKKNNACIYIYVETREKCIDKIKFAYNQFGWIARFEWVNNSGRLNILGRVCYLEFYNYFEFERNDTFVSCRFERRIVFK